MLVALTGSGGTGKTLLGLYLAAARRSSLDGGAFVSASTGGRSPQFGQPLTQAFSAAVTVNAA